MHDYVKAIFKPKF